MGRGSANILPREDGEPKVPFQRLTARALLALLEWAVANDSDQERLETYNALKPELERFAREGKGKTAVRKARQELSDG